MYPVTIVDKDTDETLCTFDNMRFIPRVGDKLIFIDPVGPPMIEGPTRVWGKRIYPSARPRDEPDIVLKSPCSREQA